MHLAPVDAICCGWGCWLGIGLAGGVAALGPSLPAGARCRVWQSPESWYP